MTHHTRLPDIPPLRDCVNHERYEILPSLSIFALESTFTTPMAYRRQTLTNLTHFLEGEDSSLRIRRFLKSIYSQFSI